MIGRDKELRLIQATLTGRAAVTGALLSGAAGVGKTRLAQEAVGGVDRRGTITLVGTVAAQAIPLAPLLTIFPDITAATEITAASARLTGRRPRPVLFVDDAQWLDLTTQSLLHMLVRAREVRVVATVRDDLPVPATVVDLWKSGHLERIDLAPLGPAESAELIAAIVGAAVEASVVAELYNRSQGMPLALRELTVESVSRGALVVRNGVGRAVGPLPPSQRLLDVVAGNLERLGAGPRGVLHAVAVAEPIALPLLLRLVDEADLESAERERVVRVSRSRLGRADRQVVTVGHPLYGEAALAGGTAAARRRVIGRLLDAAGDLDERDDGLTLRMASWCLEVGRPVPVEDLFRAVRQTHRALDPDQAEQFARALWRARPDYDTGVLYAAALGRQLKYAPAIEVYQAVKGFDLTEEQRVSRASLANEALVRLGRHDDAIAELAQAEQGVANRRGRAHLAARRGFTANLAGRTRAGLVVMDPLLRGDDGEFREAMVFAPAMLGLDGRADEALALLDRAEEWAAVQARAETPYQSSAGTWASYDRGLALMYAGRLAEAGETARRGVRAAEEEGSGFLLGGWLNLLGRVELDRGHPGSAVSVLGRVVAETPTASGGAQRAFALNGLVEAHALQGQVAAATEALAAFRENPGNVSWYPAGLATLSQALLAWRTDGQDAALELMRTAYGQAAGNAATIALTAAHMMARFGRPALGLELALELPPVQGELAAVRFAHLRALVDGDIVSLLGAAEEFERLGADLPAAEACGAAAALADRRNDPRQAAAARRTGERLLPRLEGARTPDVMSLSRGAAAALTGREREIAMLAASGLPSQEIAERLGLSVRTIHNHLQRIYGKLGVGGRRELERALDSDGSGR